MRRSVVCTFCLILALAALRTPAVADPVADFYRRRTITLIIGYTVGGGYDVYGRVVARHMNKHIPGNPSIVVQNMPGAGSLRATNYLYNVAPRDGTTMATVSRGMAIEPLIGASDTRFDPARFAWLGSGTNEVSVCATVRDSPVRTWADMLAKDFTVGGEGSASDPDIFSAVIKNVFGVRLRLVAGYPGGAEITLAMERREVEGRCGWSYSSLKLQRPEWVAQKQINIPVQLALEKSPELSDVPLIMDFATTERQRQMLRLVFSRQSMARPFVAPPGIPEDRKQALRAAFDETMADPGFLAEAKARGLDVNPVSGGDIDKLIRELYQTPADVVAEVRATIARGAK